MSWLVYRNLSIRSHQEEYESRLLHVIIDPYQQEEISEEGQAGKFQVDTLPHEITSRQKLLGKLP